MGTQADILNSSSSADENNGSNNELLSREKVPFSPFEIVGSEEHGYFVAMGLYRLTERMPTKDDAYYALENEHWDIVARMISCSIDFYQNHMKNN